MTKINMKNKNKSKNQFDHTFAWEEKPDGSMSGRVIINLNYENIENKSKKESE